MAVISAGRSRPGGDPPNASSIRWASGMVAAKWWAMFWKWSRSWWPSTMCVGDREGREVGVFTVERRWVGPLVGRDLHLERLTLHLPHQVAGRVVGVGTDPCRDVQLDGTLDIAGLQQTFLLLAEGLDGRRRIETCVGRAEQDE